MVIIVITMGIESIFIVSALEVKVVIIVIVMKVKAFLVIRTTMTIGGDC